MTQEPFSILCSYSCAAINGCKQEDKKEESSFGSSDVRGANIQIH